MDNLPQIAKELEWANYARTAFFASVVPGPKSAFPAKSSSSLTHPCR